MGLASSDPISRSGGACLAKRSKSGLKRMRQAVKRTARNQAVRSTIKTRVKQARQASTATAAEVLAAIREIDAAAGKGIIHPNAAARSKSRLMRHLAHQSGATQA